MALVLLLAGALTLSAPAAEFWVAPGGDDANPGTREKPLATATKALRLGRELRRLKDPAVNNGVRVILRDGYYLLHEPLFIRPEDSGTPASPTVLAAAPGENPVLGGGVPVTGWTKLAEAPANLAGVAQGQLWTAEIPRHNGRRLEFRQLWVEGLKAVRARTPNEGDMTRLVGWDRTKREAWIPATVPVPARLDGVEMVLLQMWEIAVLRLQSHRVEGDRAAVTFHEPESRVEFEHPWPQPVMSEQRGNAPFFLANALEFLDSPGEWFADADAGRIYYWPRPGEDLAKARVIVPALETVLRIEGTVDRPVRYVSFEGLDFAFTTWLRPSLSGHVPLQAGFYLIDAYGLKPKGTPDWRSLDNQGWIGRPPAAVVAGGAQHVNFSRCRFRNTAASGLDLGVGVTDTAVTGCLFQDIGINGLMAGFFGEGGHETHLPWTPGDERLVGARLRFTNNRLADCANEDWGGVALLAGFVRDTLIEHNEITDTSYTGISLGWGWTRTANAMRDNTVRANRILRYATRLTDTAAIYTLSAQPGTVVSRNVADEVTISPWVHDPQHWFYYYADEGTSHTVWRDNWCPDERFLKNANGPGNIWENNGPQVDPKIKAAAGLEPGFRISVEK
ncbi:MAG TPA: right-handed parallel beta-helix repeat-containing protein [Lacunisphaera sp.]|nr:right-handed parallel beta-helix repeat-containing protein [Lacunisphaera sp.]